MKRLNDVINDKFKLFKSFSVQYINTENNDENVLKDVILILQKLQNNEKLSKHFNSDDLNDIIMYFCEIYSEIKLTITERLEILKNENLNIYDEIIKDFNSYSFNNPIYVGNSGMTDEEMKHSILDDLNITRFRNAI